MNIELDILRYVKEHHIPMVKVAKAAGMVPQNIKKCITNNPKADKILSIANGLGVHPSVFFYDKDEEQAGGCNENDAASSSSVGTNVYVAEEDVNESLTNEGSDSLFNQQASDLSSSQPSPSTLDQPHGDPFIPQEEMSASHVKHSADSATIATTFCPHCGKKVRVGVVLLPEE